MKMTMSGEGQDRHLKRAEFIFPAHIGMNFPAWPAGEALCPSESVSYIEGSDEYHFNSASCPETARVGTAKLGFAQGGIYMVNSAPLPWFGIYFDQGTIAPFGRTAFMAEGPTVDGIYQGFRLHVDHLPNIASDGLELDFFNPSRPGFDSRIWNTVVDSSTYCNLHQPARGSASTWTADGLGEDEVAVTPVDVPLSGCGIDSSVEVDTDLAGTDARLSVGANLTGSSSNQKQYGMEIRLPNTLTIPSSAYGSPSQMCDETTIGDVDTGITPAAASFEPVDCPASAIVGETQYGDAAGSIYLINSPGTPQFGIYFDQGIESPYGRRLALGFDSDGRPKLSINGLEKLVTGGLKLDFFNPNRGSLPSRIWRTASHASSRCVASSQTEIDVSTWPAHDADHAYVMPNLRHDISLRGCGVNAIATTDVNGIGNPVVLELEARLSGSQNSRKLHTVRFEVPPQVTLGYENLGSTGDEYCDSFDYQEPELVNEVDGIAGLAFDGSLCPPGSVIGTASMGSAEGKIYALRLNELTVFGLYFDEGVSQPYGRLIYLSWPGETPIQPTVVWTGGFPASVSQGLKLRFADPDRGTGRAAIYWRMSNPGSNACLNGMANAQPLKAETYLWGSDDSDLDHIPNLTAPLPVAGCGISFDVSAAPNSVNSDLDLAVKTPLAGTGYDRNQYGIDALLPTKIQLNSAALGSASERCPSTSFTNATSAITTPASSKAFTRTSCPASAKVGTAKLGNATGDIYVVHGADGPQFGVYFNSGVTTPYGRQLKVSVDSSQRYRLELYGLPNTPSTGLELLFVNDQRENLPSRVWRTVGASDPLCTNTGSGTTAFATVWNWRISSGGVANSRPGLSKQVPVFGCGSSVGVVTQASGAGNTTRVSLAATLAGPTTERQLAGAEFKLPPQLTIQPYAFGSASERCPAASVGAIINVPAGPVVKSFSAATCPVAANVGDMKVGGSVVGALWVVDNPLGPHLAITFGSMGRTIPLTNNADGSTTLTIGGLNNPSTIELVFERASRPGLPSRIWSFAEPGTAACSSTTPATAHLWLQARTSFPSGIKFPDFVLPVSVSDC